MRFEMEIYSPEDADIISTGIYTISDQNEAFNLQWDDYTSVLNGPTYFNRIVEIRFTVIASSPYDDLVDQTASNTVSASSETT